MSTKQALVHIPAALVKRAAAQWPRLRQLPAIAALAPRESDAAAVRYALWMGLDHLETTAVPVLAPMPAAPSQQQFCSNCSNDAAPGQPLCTECAALENQLAELRRMRDCDLGLDLALKLSEIPEHEKGLSVTWRTLEKALARWRDGHAAVVRLQGQLEGREVAASVARSRT